VSKKLFIPAICLQLFVSCSQAGKEQRGQLWIFSNANTGSGNVEEKLSPVSFLWLAKNGSYTRDFGNFEHGSYKKAGDSLILLNDEGKTSSYSLANPFLPAYNKWRIKPSSKENDKLITERLINHCSFWQAYFTWAYRNEIPSIDVRSLPTPIKIYSNGFTLKPVTKKWAKYFFDNEDAFRSNQILEDIIRNNKIVWPETIEKYTLFISAFQQMQVFLKQAMVTQST
jgi:hypothetical protein